jgi:large subunit ribosomal protein L22
MNSMAQKAVSPPRYQLTGVRQVAKLKYLHIAPRKVRAVADLIRGLPVSEAEAQLLLSPRRPARPLLKLLRSALADAKTSSGLQPNRLIVGEIRVDQGPMFKRFMPRARGSASMIQKKMSHVTLVLTETKETLPERFAIVAEKKKKAPKKEASPAKTKAAAGSETSAKEREVPRQIQKQPGFFRRIFRRKSV